jgi:hypothetical protein
LKIKMSRISYGGTAAAVTSTALVSGLNAADAAKPIIVSALLIAALADNLIDALSIHVFQESEQLDQTDALTGTISNFAARLLLCASFVALVIGLPAAYVATAAITWGIALLATLTYLVAHQRNAKPIPEVCKHLLVAAAAISLSNWIGHSIGAALR